MSDVERMRAELARMGEQNEGLSVALAAAESERDAARRSTREADRRLLARAGRLFVAVLVATAMGLPVAVRVIDHVRAIWKTPPPPPAPPPPAPPVYPSPSRMAENEAYRHLRPLYPDPARIEVACAPVEDGVRPEGDRFVCFARIDGRRLMRLRCDARLADNEGCAYLRPVYLR